MSDSNTLFPEGYGLKRVNPQISLVGGQGFGNFGALPQTILTTFSAVGTVSAASGTWQTVLDVTSGSGYFDGAILANTSANTSPGAAGIRVTIDGTVVELTTTIVTNSPAWSTPCVVSVDGTTRRVALIPQRIPFQNSLKVEVMRGSADTYAWGVLHALEF